MIEVKRKFSMSGHRDCVYALTESSEPGIFFSAAGDGMVVAWDLANPDEGQLIARVPNSVYSIEFHQATDILCVGHNYEGIHFIDWKNRKEVGSLKCTEGAIFATASYNEFLFVGDSSGRIYQIDVAARKLIRSVHYSEKSTRSITVNPVEGHLAAGFSDNSVRILSLNDLSEVKVLQNHSNSVFSVKYHLQKNYLLSAGRDAHIMAYDVENDYTRRQDVAGHMYAINNIEFSPDGKHFVTCSMDKSIKVWDAENFNLLKVIDKARHAGHGTSVNKLLWMEKDNLLISASDDRTISAWEIEFNK